MNISIQRQKIILLLLGVPLALFGVAGFFTSKETLFGLFHVPTLINILHFAVGGICIGLGLTDKAKPGNGGLLGSYFTGNCACSALLLLGLIGFGELVWALTKLFSEPGPLAGQIFATAVVDILLGVIGGKTSSS